MSAPSPPGQRLSLFSDGNHEAWKMKKHWDRYGWIICILLLLLFFLPLVWSSSSFCRNADSDCLRNWISATGSWAALFAAIPTIFYLSRQVQAAMKANENSAKIQLRRNYALSKKTKGYASLLDMHAQAFITVLDRRIPEFSIRPLTRHQARQRMSAINDLLTDGTFGRFEEEIEFLDKHNVQQIKRHIMLFSDMIAATDGPILSEETRQLILVICVMCKKYAADSIAAADGFVVEADGMTGKNYAHISRNGAA
ncbi:hypothetical protein A6U86_31010 [Rhizobium sp. AC27/96]|nr:hypothetical protein A6U86_31010 [Rhizobium sp. AC27/96]